MLSVSCNVYGKKKWHHQGGYKQRARCLPLRRVAKFDPGWEGYLVGQAGLPALAGHTHLSCKRDQIRTRDYMDRRVTPPKRVTSPTWGPPPPCKQALREVHILRWICNGHNLRPSDLSLIAAIICFCALLPCAMQSYNPAIPGCTFSRLLNGR